MPTQMKNQKLDAPQREHAVMAMLSTLQMLPEGRERGMMMEAFIAFAYRCWNWNVEKLHEEITACRKAAIENKSQLITWFDSEGFGFEVKSR